MMTQLMFEHMQAATQALNIRYQLRMEEMQREALRLQEQLVQADIANRAQQLTKRESLAACALTGITGHISGVKKQDNETAAEAEARWCFERADAMIKIAGMVKK